MTNNKKTTKGNKICSFCGSHKDDVKTLFVERSEGICDACVGLCTEILIEKDDKFATRLTDLLREIRGIKNQDTVLASSLPSQVISFYKSKLLDN